MASLSRPVLFFFCAGALGVGSGAAVALSPARPGPCERASPKAGPLDPFGIRAVVVEQAERIPDVLPLLRSLGANTLVTNAGPDAATGRAALQAGVRYIAWMTTREIERAGADPALAQDLRSVPNLSGIYYEDDEAVEGYTSPEEQRRAYSTLKALLPGALVLHPTRLDPIAGDPGYLDAVFRPDFTDAIVPYYYPVGTTGFGIYREKDSWEERLTPFLEEVARRAPGKPVLPVLQGFEQIGYPVSAAFPARQFDVYASIWPDNPSAAVFEWGASPHDAPLVGFGFRPALREGVRELFRRLARADAWSDACMEDRRLLR